MIGTPFAQTLAEFCIDKKIIFEIDDFEFNSNEDRCICGSKVFQDQPINFYRILPLICCRNCRTISDFSRPYVYNTAPIRYQELEWADFPQLTLNFSPLVIANPNWSKIEKVSDKLLGYYFKNFDCIPGILKHFTTKDGACGIINSSELWAFNTSYMNDPNEVKHGQDIIIKVYEGLKSCFTAEVQMIFERAIRIICDPVERENFFIVCFSRCHKSIYHWKHYGEGNKGIELGFSANHLGLTQFRQIRKVIYKDSIKEQLVTEVFKEICLLYESLPKCAEGWDFEMNLASFAALTNNHLAEFIFTFKETKWDSEDEYRLIVNNERSVMPEYKFNGRSFVKVKLSQISPDNPLLPLVGVIFGERTPEVDKIEVCRALIDEGYSHVSIKELS